MTSRCIRTNTLPKLSTNEQHLQRHKIRNPRLKLVMTVLAAIIGFQFQASGFAQDLGRNVTNGTWENSAEWVDSSGNGNLSTSSNNVYIGYGSFPHATALNTATVSLSSAGFANAIYIGDTAGNNGTLNLLAGGSLTASSMSIGESGGTGTLNLGAQQVTLSGGFHLGSGGTVTRTSGGITADSFSVSGGTFTIAGSDSFTSSGSVWNGGAVTNNVALNLSSGLSITGAGTTFSSNAAINSNIISAWDNATFNVNNNITTNQFNLGAWFINNDGSILNLNSGTLSANDLTVYGSTINRNGGNLSANSFSLNNGANLTYQAGDSFVNYGSILGGSTLSTSQALSLTSYLYVDNSTLDLNGNTLTLGGQFSFGNGSTLVRGAGGAIQADSFGFYGGSTYNYDGTDQFTTSGSVSGGATVSNNAALNLSSGLSITGAGTTFTANAAVDSTNYLYVWDNATMHVNANITTDQFNLGAWFINNDASVLNLNSGTLSANSLTVYGSTINRNGGNLSANSFYLDSGANLTYQTGDSFVNYGTIWGGSTLLTSQALSLTQNLVVDNSTLNLAGNTLTLGGQFSFGNGSTLIRGAGGAIHANSFGFYGGSTYNYDGSDQFTSYGSVSSGATLTTSQALSLNQNLTVDNSTLNLAGNTLTLGGQFSFGNGSTLIRGSGGAIQADSFNIYDATYTYDGADQFTTSGSVSGGSAMTNNAALNLSSHLSIDGVGTNFTANAAVNSNSISVWDNATLNVNDNITTSQFNLGQPWSPTPTLNLNSGTLTANNLTVYGSTINRNGGNLSANSLSLNNGASLALQAGDVIDSTLSVSSSNVSRLAGSLILTDHLSVTGDSQMASLAGDVVEMNLHLGLGGISVLTLNQQLGEATGLTLNAGSSGALSIHDDSYMHLIFDGQAVAGVLDWGFRWSGDHVTTLSSLLGSKILFSGAPESISVIRNEAWYGDYTYIGYVSAIPEPGSLLLMASGLVAGLCFRRRSKRQR